MRYKSENTSALNQLKGGGPHLRFAILTMLALIIILTSIFANLD